MHVARGEKRHDVGENGDVTTISELGNFLLCLAAGLALLLSVHPPWGVTRQDRRLTALIWPLTYELLACTGGAFLLPVHTSVVDDFTVRYVAKNFNSALPMWYRVVAT